MGKPGDREGQLAVIRATLNAILEIYTPGTVVHLPFKWDENPDDETGNRIEPPITKYLKKNIRYVLKFVKRDIPPQFQV